MARARYRVCAAEAGSRAFKDSRLSSCEDCSRDGLWEEVLYMAGQDGEDSRSLVPAVTRTAAVLDLLAAHPGTPMPVSELARRLRLPRTSVGNLCRELINQRFLEEYPSGFTLGQRQASEVGSRSLPQRAEKGEVAWVAQP